MAREANLGTDILLYIDTTSDITAAASTIDIPGTFKLVACLTDNGLDMSSDQIDTASKCSGLFKTALPGQTGWTFSASGQQVTLSGGDITSGVNHNALFKLARSKEKFWAATFDPDNYSIRSGVVFISSYSEANPNSAAATFSMTLQGDGDIFDQEDLDITP